MAEDDEIARLRQMESSAQESMAWGDSGADDGVGHSEQHVKEEPLDTDDNVLRATSTASFDAGQYNPNSQHLTMPPPVVDSLTGSRNSTPNSTKGRPKKVGGFLADTDDEDEVESKPTTTSLQPPATRTMSKSPLHLEATPVQVDASTGVTGATDNAPSAPNARKSQSPSITRGSVQPEAAQQTTQPKARLPHDKIGILEDRIAEDPRGDIDAWMALIHEHESRSKLDDARAVFERFLQVVPTAVDVWVQYLELELTNDNFYAAEQIFSKSLLSVANVGLWKVYLNYVRRRNDLTNDFSGSARATITQAYDFVLANIGMDRDAGAIWQDYIQFIRSGPGQIGGSDWRDQQKMDQLRKTYQRAVCIPMSNVNQLWKEYDQFEMSLNKITGRKFLQERSPSYMTARSANTYMENITRGLERTNLPKLPPAPGFDGAEEYLKQVDIWNQWINWEKEDPLVLKDDDLKAYKDRVLYTYKQALMALRYWPEMWVDAAEWAFNNGFEKEGNEFLTQGIDANPESCLLAFKQADRLETVLPMEEGDEGLASRGAAIRAPYNKCLDALYHLLKKLKTRESAEVQKIQDAPSPSASERSSVADETEDTDGEKKPKKTAKELQIETVQQRYAEQTKLVQRTLSFVWIALMRAMRRVQGKGKVGAVIGGSRQILNDARLRGKITSDVYVASALIEHNVYKDPAGTKILERGAKLFPEDEVFILEYLKHLLNIGDTTNARAVFETSVNRLVQKPETLPKAKPLFEFFHKYESSYGELSQISRLESRMAELFPSDPKLLHFANRYTGGGFDPAAVRPIVSPSQMRPKEPLVRQSIEQVAKQDGYYASPKMAMQEREVSARPTYAGQVMQNQREISPRNAYPGVPPPQIISPKRAHPHPYESASDSERPRKLPRGESPLKGAAGRRLDQQRRTHGGPQSWEQARPVATIPRDITFLLSIIPRAEDYRAKGFVPEKIVDLLARTRVPEFGEWRRERELGSMGRYQN